MLFYVWIVHTVQPHCHTHHSTSILALATNVPYPVLYPPTLLCIQALVAKQQTMSKTGPQYATDNNLI